MTVAFRTTPTNEWRRRIDAAALDLVRLVMADTWDREAAAHELRVRVHDDHRLLRSLRAKVARAHLDRPTAVGSRASATVDLALATSRAGSLIPRQRSMRRPA